MAAKDPVGIVIPLYKPMPDQAELASLQQCARILGHYPIVFVCPQGLDLSNYQGIFPRYGVETFPPKYFRNIAGYNRLLLSAGFYSRFGRYPYIFIYQPDAWVFRDELTEWCQRGYDYIGARGWKFPKLKKTGWG
ncbi:MAG: hypothetical protein HC896_06520 [Bacteroidales bacterium]|nr:hypothetical protein [Bacteroidales bacterium]